MHPTSLIAFGLILATAVAAYGIATKARADHGSAVVWIQFSTSAHGNSVQHLTTAYYLGTTVKQALMRCEAERKQIRDGLAKEGLTPIIEPKCSMQKPWSWIGDSR